MFNTKNKSLILSYLTLRKLIGILGMLLPLICYLGGKLFAGLVLQDSISSYYHTNVRDLFVGLMVCVALFFMTYHGYEKIDRLATFGIGLAGFGIAIFPCLKDLPDVRVGFFQLAPAVSHSCHLACAFLFFLFLALNSIFLFTKTDKSKKMTKKKKIRNRVYVFCGAGILICLSLLSYINIFPQSGLNRGHTVYLLETIMLVMFGFSWFIKGKTLLKD